MVPIRKKIGGQIPNLRTEIFYGRSGDYHLLVMRIPSCDAYFPFLICWTTFGEKWAWPRALLMFWASLPNQKVGQLGGPFGTTVISKS